MTLSREEQAQLEAATAAGIPEATATTMAEHMNEPIDLEDLPAPLLTDKSGFGRWLRDQIRRPDAVGGLARGAIQDPMWPGGEDLNVVKSHFQKMGSRPFILKTVTGAWVEYEAHVRKQRHAKAVAEGKRTKRIQAKKARKRTRQNR